MHGLSVGLLYFFGSSACNPILIVVRLSNGSFNWASHSIPILIVLSCSNNGPDNIKLADLPTYIDARVMVLNIGHCAVNSKGADSTLISRLESLQNVFVFWDIVASNELMIILGSFLSWQAIINLVIILNSAADAGSAIRFLSAFNCPSPTSNTLLSFVIFSDI